MTIETLTIMVRQETTTDITLTELGAHCVRQSPNSGLFNISKQKLENVIQGKTQQLKLWISSKLELEMLSAGSVKM